MILGIEDPFVIAGYAVAIGLVVVCVVYGWMNRDKGEDSNG